MLAPSGAIDVANGLRITSVSLHSAYPGATGLNEVSGTLRQTVSIPNATGSEPTRAYNSPVTWDVPACDIAFYGLWNGNTLKAIAANGGAEKIVSRVLTTGAILAREHGCVVGDAVVCLGSWDSAFAVGTPYYVVSAGPDTLSISPTRNGEPIKPASNLINTSMLISKIKVATFGEPGSFTLLGMTIRWSWSDTGAGVVVEPQGYRFVSSRPIPPQEIVLPAGGAPHSILQYITGGDTTKIEIVSGNTELVASGASFNAQIGALVPGATQNQSVFDIVVRASNDVIADYSGQEFYFRVWTSREVMARDDTGNHANTSYRYSPYWNSDATNDGLNGYSWGQFDSMCYIWKNAGGDYDAANPLGTLTMALTNYPSGTKFTLDITAAVKQFADGRMNYGFFLRPNTGNKGRHYFYSREDATASNRPVVTITGKAAGSVICEGDGNVAFNSKNTDGATTLQLAGAPGTGEFKPVFLWFGFDTFFNANGITKAADIASATLTLTLEQTRTVNTSTYTLYHIFAPSDVAVSQPAAGIAWAGTPTGDPEHPTVGLRGENLKYHKSVYWMEDWSTYPDKELWRQFVIQSKSTTASGNVNPSWGPNCSGDLIVGDDNEFPSIATMQAMWPGMRSLRMYWEGEDSPVGHIHVESDLAQAKFNATASGNGYSFSYYRIKSIAADGLITLVDTFPDRQNFKFGENPFGDPNKYPRGSNPVYILPGTSMPLPAGFPAFPTRIANAPISGGAVGSVPVERGPAIPFTGTTIPITVPYGPPVYALCVPSPGANNTFYLSLTPDGAPLVPGSAAAADLGWTDQFKFASISPARRNATTPMAADFNPLAKNTNGTYRFKKSKTEFVDKNKPRAFDEMYFAAYYYVPNTFEPYSQGAKQFIGGVDFQYPEELIRGMGYGNGGSLGDGIGGSTVRGHSAVRPFIPLGQKGLNFTFYNYCWYPDNTIWGGYYDVFLDKYPTILTGGNKYSDRFLGAFVEFDRWNHFEWYSKPNSLVPNTAPVFIGDDVTPNYNCIIDGVVQPCPTGYACYNPIHAVKDTSIDPATGKQRNPFGGAYPNTFRSPIGLPATWANGAAPFKYSYVTNGKTYEYELFSPSGRSFWGPSNSQFSISSARTDKSFRRACIERLPTKMWIDQVTQKSDGMVVLWINGREAHRFEGIGTRHVDICKDGVTPLSIWGPLFSCQVGGVDRDFFECYTYIGPMVCASERIGPFSLS